MKPKATHRVVPRPTGPCDDHVEGFPDDGIFVVVDASGPTYGGYHRPVGVEPGMNALIATWREARGEPFAAMHKALAHANAAMLERGGQWARDARNVIESGQGEIVHPTASVTAVALIDDRWIVGHVGSNAGWLVRQGYAERIAAPHTLRQQMIEDGRSGDIEPWQALVVTRLLGYGVAVNPDVIVTDAEPGDLLAVCSNGLWIALAEDRLEAPARKGLRGEALLDAWLEYGDPSQDRAGLVVEAG